MAFDPMKKGCKSLSLTTVEAGYVSCGLYFQFTATIFSISEFIFLLALSPPGFGLCARQFNERIVNIDSLNCERARHC